MVTLLHPFCARGGSCNDPEKVCSEPCPAENSCVRHEDCPEGYICDQACLPSWCVCVAPDDTWGCSDDCAGECLEWFGPAGPIAQSDIYVDTNATGPVHDRSSWCNAYLTLDEALESAATGDTVFVAVGTYNPDTTSE